MASPQPSPTSNRTLRVANVTVANAGEMRALFLEVFGKPMSEAFWRWKYRDACSHGLGVWDGDRLVAFYGGIGTDIVCDGKAAKAVQIVDVMVLASARYGVRSQSPFFVATSSFLDRYIGYTRPYLLGYGFPSDRHLHLAKHLGLYAAVGGMRELTLLPAARTLADRMLFIESLTARNIDHCAPLLDLLWQRMQASLPTAILVRKQAQWLKHRYLEHPEHQYRCWLWRQRVTGKPFALAVLKLESERALVMDVLATAADFPKAMRLTAIRTAREQSTPVVFWLSSAWQQQLQLDGLPAKQLPISTPANIWTEGPAPADLQDRWCLTAGDTDYL